jgi:prevent-host-death family protein
MESMMAEISVADAKNGLPKLIDRVLAGEHIVITRHGHRVAELRPTATPAKGSPSHYSLLRKARAARKPVDITSVELLNAMYDEDE